MESQSSRAGPPAVRVVSDADGLKALADPTRLAILAALMGNGPELPVMSVKELAAELGEPQTKLYRHVRVLEAAGLVKVAATRIVSGIVEQRYQACQRDLTFGPGMLRKHRSETEAIARAMVDRFSDGFFAASASGPFPADDLPADQAYRKSTYFASETTISRARASELRAKIDELTDLVNGDRDDPDGVPVRLLVGYYSPQDGQDRS